eukprot:gene32217-16775_t
MFHNLVVLGPVVARAPEGLENSEAAINHRSHPDSAEIERQEAACKAILDGHPTRETFLLGKGSGLGYDKTPYCSYATRKNVHILFSGEVAEWPGIDAVEAAHDAFIHNTPPLEEDDAHFLLDFYDTFSSETNALHDNEEVLQRALTCLAAVKGSFAFVIYDQEHHRVLAARDAEGSQPLFWGATENGQLLFGSVSGDLDGCNPTSTAFPSGCLFSSVRPIVVHPGPNGWMIEGDEMPGQLVSFVKHDAQHYSGVRAIPRVTSKGVMQGTVYKVSSQADMDRTISQ